VPLYAAKGVRMKRLLVVGLLALFLGGCSLVANDARQAATLAAKYGDAQAAECFGFVADGLDKQASLSEEPNAGLLTLAEKARIVRQFAERNREAFAKACGPLMADGLLALAR